MKKIFSTVSILIIAVLLAGGAALLPVSNVSAMSNSQVDIDRGLTKAYNVELQWLSKQETAIEKANQAGNKVQDLIDKGAAAGFDVSGLQSTLDTFQGEMVTVQSYHQQAADALSAHNGFDGSGNITDRSSARQTVTDARRALGEAHMTMTQASWALRDAVYEWKNVNFPQE